MDDIKDLFILMKKNEIAELNLEQDEIKIHIVSTHAPVVHSGPVQPVMPIMQGVSPMSVVGMQPAAAPAPAPAEKGAASGEANAEAGDEEKVPSNWKTISSPMVGTFYRAPAPDSAPFCQVGDRVKEDTTLCIIEAMKLMNELKAEMKGRVAKILVENGVPVEYNQPLFMIEPA